MAEYVWVDADGGTRSKSRVSFHNTPISYIGDGGIVPSLPVDDSKNRIYLPTCGRAWRANPSGRL